MDVSTQLPEDVGQLQQNIARLGNKIERNMEQLRMEIRTGLEGFRTEFTKMFDEMLARMDDINAGKQISDYVEKMKVNGDEAQTNDLDPIVEEPEVVAEGGGEDGVEATRDTKIGAVIVINQAQIEQPIKLEENGQLEAWLNGDNIYSVEQQFVANQTSTVDLVKLILPRPTPETNNLVLGVSLSTKLDACAASPSMSSQTMTFMIAWPSKLSLTTDFYYTQPFFTQFPQVQFAIWNSCLNMILNFGELCGEMGMAQLLFDNVPQRNIVSWNFMITQLVKRGEFEVAYGFLLLMPKRNVRLWTRTMSGCVHCRKSKEEVKFFMEIEELTVVLWSAKIKGLAMHGLAQEALRVFARMIKIEVEPNGVTFVGLLHACNHMGLVNEDCRVFDYVIDGKTVFRSAMIIEYAQSEHDEDATMLFSEREAVVWFYPNTITMASIVLACVCIEIFYHKQGTQGYVVKTDLGIDHYVQNAFMDRYSRMRKLQISKPLFDNMKVRNIAIWNTMKTGDVIVEHLVAIASTYYGVLEPYMQTLCQFTSNAKKGVERTVAFQKIEFLSSNYDKKIDSPSILKLYRHSQEVIMILEADVTTIENLRLDERPLLVFHEGVKYTFEIDLGVYDTHFLRIPHNEEIYTGASITAMVTSPVLIFEPMKMLQKIEEWICSLLNPADECEDPYLQLVYASSWAMSVYYAYQHMWKLFNPIIGKANDMVDHEGITFIFEQVYHHPSMIVEQAEHFIYDVTSKLKTKKKMER